MPVGGVAAPPRAAGAAAGGHCLPRIRRGDQPKGSRAAPESPAGGMVPSSLVASGSAREGSFHSLLHFEPRPEWRNGRRRRLKISRRRRRAGSNPASGSNGINGLDQVLWACSISPVVLTTLSSQLAFQRRSPPAPFLQHAPEVRRQALVMAYKLLDMAQWRWRRLNAAHLLPLVRAGVTFVDGVQQEREEVTKPPRKAA